MREERSVCHAVEKLDRHETQAGVVFTAHLECSSCGERQRLVRSLGSEPLLPSMRLQGLGGRDGRGRYRAHLQRGRRRKLDEHFGLR